ncbi:hypothetical protein P8825_15460 [Shouchella clausii]|uniref:hypothetical protein n=1 Tax=Shouchella clausii TaxID=79880 RepID=UPI002DBDE018|nr:hypothetical protein [Shouchella clausii]MEB5480963.1 hypothetical protein [Shouchella clausii]
MEIKNKEVLATSKNLLKQFNLSVDVRPYENQSWAVISIQGKPEYVKFVSLNNSDMRSIRDYIKHFEHTNKTIDAPGMHFLKWQRKVAN